jgi:exosome complex component RRP45
VRGEIVAPYLDRPSEGLLQFNVSLSPAAEAAGHTSPLITRLLEKSTRESDAIDVESLCVVSGEWVWLITCDVRILNFDGNATDACALAALAALRAFRRPEVSVSLSTDNSTTDNSTGGASGMVITLHSSDEREPLPLALHHTPLAVTFGVLEGEKAVPTKLVADCTASEESALDGSLLCSVNSHSELCAINLPGKVGIPAALLLRGSQLALKRGKVLHAAVEAALLDLERRLEERQAERLRVLQRVQREQRQTDSTKQAGRGAGNAPEAGGIDKSDPILNWQMLHASVGLSGEPQEWLMEWNNQMSVFKKKMWVLCGVV